MTEHRVTDGREAIPGPGESKLALEGNSNARFFVPKEEEPQPQPRAENEPDAGRSGFGDRVRGGFRALTKKLRRS